LLAANGRIATVVNTIASTIATVESWSQSTFNPLPKNGARSDVATAADTLPKAAVCIEAPITSRTAENARRIRPSNFIGTADCIDEPFTLKLSRKEQGKFESNGRGFELIQTVSAILR
jgi:hypothetical protein